MENPTITIISRLCVGLVAVAMTTAVVCAQNQLQNAGFETAGTNDSLAANWTMFNGAARQGTNNTTVSIRSGLWSLQTGAPQTYSLDACGAYQDVTASPGQNWRLTGYALTWINAKLTGPDSYGVLELQFLDSGNNILQITDSALLGQSQAFPVNTWVPLEADATAPSGTAKVRAYAMYLGDILDGGNIFFDDLSLYQPSTSGTASFTAQSGVQISWPTSSPTNGNTDYQLQRISALVYTNLPVVNVCSNGGFEGSATPWLTFNGGGWVSSNSYPVRTGGGSMRLMGASPSVPPGCWEDTATITPSLSVTPGQVWNLQGYGYDWSTLPMHNAGSRALLKIAWLNSSGTAVPPVSNDPNLIGSFDTAPYYGIVSSPQMNGTSPQNAWTFMQSQGTVPSNAVAVAIYCLLVPAGGSTETVFFDDVSFFQPVSFNGWVNYGPLWLGNGLTNSMVDAIGTNAARFYRMTTP
ncbi:MAG TPA: hypothetical protein VMP11_19165 [Verrucomicrobiae bacterium]|nr:hypothetical protein [Verrucomicrobiae bacterium]